ncbi:hypothetical protein OSB04_002015 [Centaurea solstitialis]|uniref:F-box domain-containing protein n=1 Tax=Centaurea solstitialis TaxID=347529 RepID=A0AA38TTW8_9ASTR|nr:hypothetical protein OSB04_002015 [Centaurea solstitialis]
MEEKRDWLQMPDEIMGGMILQQLDAVEILESVQKVCRNWRSICKDPAMWKIIDIRLQEVKYSYASNRKKKDFEKLCKQAVHRSCGELIDIRLRGFGNDDLLDFISGWCLRFLVFAVPKIIGPFHSHPLSSSKLTRLRLSACYGITGCGLNNALKRLSYLETLELSYTSILVKDIEVIAHNCPLFKSFTLKTHFLFYDAQVLAIANNMPTLRHLKLVGNTMDTEDGIPAILNGCPHLESLDICMCFCHCLDENLEKLCRERIKEFKFKQDGIPKGYRGFDMQYSDYDTIGDCYEE